MKTITFAFLAAFSTLAVGEPIPEWHARAEKWCLAFDTREACIDGPVAVTRIGESAIGFEVTRGEDAKLYLAFDFSSSDKDGDKPILDAPFEYEGTDMIGSVRMQTFTIALGDTESSRTTSYVLAFDSFVLQISGNCVAAEVLARDFAEQWNSARRPDHPE